MKGRRNRSRKQRSVATTKSAGRQGPLPRPIGRGEIEIRRRKAAHSRAEVLSAHPEIRAGGHQHMRIGVAAASEVDDGSRFKVQQPRTMNHEPDIRRLHRRVVRGFQRGNNANNSNASPLYVNANNAPSNTNSNYAFGTCRATAQHLQKKMITPSYVYCCITAILHITHNKPLQRYDLLLTRQVQSLADVRAEQVRKRV